MSKDIKRKLRCAVYTRKSSEEGLEQEFNSLHAQREACEAYIASQRSEGWALIREHYDDGGVSGGTLERPGLKMLLADIEEGLIDVVVVYKIGRLSRSLMDFSKLVEVFDRNNVTFVSVNRVLDFACGSGSLLLNVRKQMGPHGIGKIYGQEKNITTYNLARMNMLLHGVKDSEFEIHHGDSLLNDWEMLAEENPAKKVTFDAVVANPPFSYRWDPTDALGEDLRFKNYGLAPKSAADFAFLLHGFHFLGKDGTMAIILPHGVLFRGGAEARIRTKLLKDGHIDTVIGLPANLFFSTGIPVCILVLKRCKKPDDVLFINASEHFEKGKRQNRLLPEHIAKIVDTYQFRKEEDRYARRVGMEEIKRNDFNLNISRYVSTAEAEEKIDLPIVHGELVEIEGTIGYSANKHNTYLEELGLSPLPIGKTGAR